jgi:hypothetical protein
VLASAFADDEDLHVAFPWYSVLTRKI